MSQWRKIKNKYIKNNSAHMYRMNRIQIQVYIIQTTPTKYIRRQFFKTIKYI